MSSARLRSPVAGTHFGVHLRTWRTRHGISLRELATRVHVDYGHLGKIERGARTASRALAEACDAEFAAGGELWQAWTADEAAAGYRPAQLPSAARSFVGRHAEARTVEELLTAPGVGGPQVLVVTGAPGVGKTALALHCANDVAPAFPDGILFADLRGYSDETVADPDDVLEQFLLALGVSTASVPRTTEARASLYRSVLRDRRILVVLDNAGNSDQVRRLLPGGPRCGVLVTSRLRLSGLTIRHGARTVELPPLCRDEALDVLRGIAGAARVDAEPAAAVTLAAQCSHLPLALCVAAERVAVRPHLRLVELVAELAVESETLDLLTVADDAALELRRVFSWSYRSLPPDAAYLFRLLGLHWDTEISRSAAAALAGWPQPRTHRFLEVLADAHLLQEVGNHRYRCHDLLRIYAAELAANTETDDARRAATDRLARWYAATAHLAGEVLAPYRSRPELTVPTDDLTLPRLATWADAVAWCDLELPALTGAARHAVHSGVPAVAHEIPMALRDFFALRTPWASWITMNTSGLTVARTTADRAAEAGMLENLGLAHLDLGEHDRATAMFEQSLTLRSRLGDRAGQGWSLLCLGNTRLARDAFQQGATLLEEALAVFLEVGDPWPIGVCRGHLGAAYTQLKRFDDALRELTESERVVRDAGDRVGEGRALDLLAKVHCGRENWPAAVDYLSRAIDLRARIGDSRGQASTTFTLGRVQRDRGHRAAAAGFFRAALILFTAIGDPAADEVRACLRAVPEHGLTA
jgi:tetratricopeptide (TPR) repeat protein